MLRIQAMLWLHTPYFIRNRSAHYLPAVTHTLTDLFKCLTFITWIITNRQVHTAHTLIRDLFLLSFCRWQWNWSISIWGELCGWEDGSLRVLLVTVCTRYITQVVLHHRSWNRFPEILNLAYYSYFVCLYSSQMVCSCIVLVFFKYWNTFI